jgi:hypothetical protein
MNSKFRKTADGYLVYKAFRDTTKKQPSQWQIKTGAVISEVVNYDRGNPCACGVSFGTKKWVAGFYQTHQVTIWRCLIRWKWLGDICVPYNSDGEARCGKLELLEKVKG